MIHSPPVYSAVVDSQGLGGGCFSGLSYPRKRSLVVLYFLQKRATPHLVPPAALGGKTFFCMKHFREHKGLKTSTVL